MKNYNDMTKEEKIAYLQSKRAEAIKLMQPEKELTKKKKNGKKVIKGVAILGAIVIGTGLVYHAAKDIFKLQDNDDNDYNNQNITITSEKSIDEQISNLKEQTGELLDLEEEDYKNYILALNDEDLENDYTIAKLAHTANEVSSYNVIELTNNYAYDAGQLVGNNVSVIGEGEAKAYLEEYYELRNNLFDSIKNNEEDSKVEAKAMKLYKFIITTLADKEKIDLDGNIFDINSLDEETSKLIIYDMATNDLALINTILNQPELTKKTIEGESPLPYKAVEDTILYDYTDVYESLVNCYEGYAKIK